MERPVVLLVSFLTLLVDVDDTLGRIDYNRPCHAVDYDGAAALDIGRDVLKADYRRDLKGPGHYGRM